MATLRTGSFGSYYGSLSGESEPLKASQMETNAKYVYSFLTNEGWTKNAISALLGNLEAESTINPGRWQSDSVGNTSLGYGLVQWTPSTKYTVWCSEEGLSDPSEMDSNLERILYELKYNLQWIATSSYNMSFKEFSVSTASVSDLAKAFLLNYERPADQSEEVQNYRAELASKYYSILNSETPTTPTDPEHPLYQKERKTYNFILFQANRRRKQWIRKQ